MGEAHLAAGVRLAGYLVERPIGRGGMGRVLLARDERLGRPVALKVLAEHLAADAGFRERMLRESRLAASLDHPNVVPIYDAGEADGRLFLAMRYVDGTDLRVLLRREGALDPARAIAIAAQVADALDAAHRRGLVHRDVKPSNVLLDQQDGREHAYLADFGLTQSAADAGPADGHLMGTVDYVAPEQVRGELVDGRADQYALACLLFECLTGDRPFRHGSEVATIFAHLEEEPPSAHERRAALPPAVDAVLARGMAKDPAERYASCTDLVSAARGALGLTSAPRPTSRRRTAALGAVLAAVIVTAAAVLLASGDDGGAARAPATGTLVRIDPARNAVAGRTPVAGYPGALAVTSGGVWIADFQGGDLWRYQPGSAAPAVVPSNGEPRDLAVSGGKVYVASDEGGTLTGLIGRYDAESGLREDGSPILACALAAGDGVVWAAGCPYVQRLSTGPGPIRTVTKVFLPFRAPATTGNGRVQFREMAVGGGSLWVLGDAFDRRLWRLDARTGRRLATLELGFAPHSVAFAAGRAWITDAVRDVVVPLEAATNRLAPPIAVGRGASGIATAAGSLWVANTLAGTVTRIDPRSGRVLATIDVGGLPRQLDGDGRVVWVTEHA